MVQGAQGTHHPRYRAWPQVEGYALAQIRDPALSLPQIHEAATQKVRRLCRASVYGLRRFQLSSRDRPPSAQTRLLRSQKAVAAAANRGRLPEIVMRDLRDMMLAPGSVLGPISRQGRIQQLT